MTALRTLPAVTLLVVLGLMVVIVTRAASGPGSDLIVERGVLQDTGGTLTLDTARTAAFTPFEGPYAFGNRGIPIWFRLTVPPQPADTRNLVLVLQPATLESARVFVPASAGWRRVDTGSSVDFRDRDSADLNLTVPFKVSAGVLTELYVQIQSRTAVVHPQVLTPEAASAFDTRLHTGVGLYVGLTLVMSLLSTLLWLSSGNGLWGMAAAFDVITLLQIALALGIVAKYLLPEGGHLLPGLWLLSSATHTTAACVLFGLLVRMLEAPRWITIGYLMTVPFYLGLLTLMAIGQDALVLPLVNLGALVMTLWCIPSIALIGTRDRVLRWMYRGLASFLVLYLVYFFTPILRTGESSLLNLYPTIPSNLVTMVMVMAILARRTLLDSRQREHLQRVQEKTAERLRLEQAHHAQTSGMLGMIMHEVKNPLATIQVASELLRSGRSRSEAEQSRRFASIQGAVESINTVLERCLDVDQLDHSLLKPNVQPEELTALLRHWYDQHPQKARLQVDLPTTLTVDIDGSLLLLMLGNLVDNALKYSPPDSAIDLRLLGEGQWFRVEVRNEVGRAGWPDEGQLFQKFYRSAQAKRDPGSGLGLYWVRAVSSMLQGDIRYAREGNSALFVLRMPR